MINQTYTSATSFSMFIDGDEYSGLQMKITDFQIPNVSADAVEQATRILQGKHAASRLKFAPLTVNVLTDAGLSNIKPVHNWIVNNVIQNETVRKDIRLIGYAANETQVFTVNFQSAFPTSINIDKFDSQDSSDTLITAQIEFAYDLFTYG